MIIGKTTLNIIKTTNLEKGELMELLKVIKEIRKNYPDIIINIEVHSA